MENKKWFLLSWRIIIFVCLLLLPCSFLFTDELIWKPINPSFGGNPYNSTWMLNTAQAENKFTDEDLYTYSEQDPIDQFQETLNRLILNRLASQIVDSIYEGDELKIGQFEMGNFMVDISEEGDIMIITIFDLLTGNQTTLEMPYF